MRIFLLTDLTLHYDGTNGGSINVASAQNYKISTRHAALDGITRKWHSCCILDRPCLTKHQTPTLCVDFCTSSNNCTYISPLDLSLLVGHSRVLNCPLTFPKSIPVASTTEARQGVSYEMRDTAELQECRYKSSMMWEWANGPSLPPFAEETQQTNLKFSEVSPLTLTSNSQLLVKLTLTCRVCRMTKQLASLKARPERNCRRE